MSLTPKQLERRRSGVGASEIATVAGISPWGSLIDLWRAKVEGRTTVANYRMDLGTEVEAPIARVWAARRGVYLARVDTLQSSTHPYALATPDRAVYLDAKARGDGRHLRSDLSAAVGLLQVKSSNWRTRGAWGKGVKVYVEPDEQPGSPSDEIPAEYWVQVQWEMAVAKLATCTVVVDFDKTELFEFVVAADATIFGELYELASRFMRECVEKATPPPPDWTEQYGRFVRSRFPSEFDRKTKPRLVVAEHEPELAAAVSQLALMREIKDRAEAEASRLRRVVELAIGEGTGLEGPGWKITWLKNKDGSSTDLAGQSLDRRLIAALAIQALPAGDLRDSFAARLQASDTAFHRVKPGPRVMRFAFPDFTGELTLDAGATLLSLPVVSAPSAKTLPEPTKEGTDHE